MGEGIITKALSGYYYVQDGERLVTCRARGRLRLDKSSPLVGDRVSYEPTPEGGGYVLKILPRRNWFVRPAVANIDVMVIVAAAVNPVSEPFLPTTRWQGMKMDRGLRWLAMPTARQALGLPTACACCA